MEPSSSLPLNSELYARVDTVQMVMEGVNQVGGECCARHRRISSKTVVVDGR